MKPQIFSNQLTDQDVCEYYFQIYDNVKHMKKFIKNLHTKYYNEELKN